MRITKLALALCALMAGPAFAQDGSNVLVVVNSASPDGQQIAERYSAARSIPADNIVRITTALTEDIERERYEHEIEGTIGAWFARRAAQDKILYIVLTKGIPLRIRGIGGMTGSVSSVDSELTLLYRKLLGIAPQPFGRIANPYYHGNRQLSEAQRFSHAAHDMYLVTR